MADQNEALPGNEKKDDEKGADPEVQPMLPADPDASPPKPEDEDQGTVCCVPEKPPPESYAFLDGLRGYGAFAVYLQHYLYEMYPYFQYGRPEKDSKAYERYHEPPQWLLFSQATPLKILTNGTFWVCLFFILSGFVLTLRWFKVRNWSSIYGGIFRRYLRLGIPLFFILQIYYLVAKMDVTTQEQTLVEIKQKSGFLEFLLDSLIGTWYGNNDYAYVTWTLTVELWATYFVYIVAQTVVWYRHRYILYIIILLFIYIPRISDDLKLTEYQFRADQNTSRLDLNLRSFLPYFTYGVAIADSENLKGDLPLNALRKLDWWWKIPINLVLVFIFLSYGSMTIPETCKKRDEFDCAYMTMVTGGAFADAFWFFEALAALAGFILALTSSAFQCVLDSAPFWFLGKVSYTLYLGHLLIVKWPAMEMVGYFHTTLGIDYDLAVLYNFLIWTPVALLLAWGLEVLIDTPSKNFAHAVDVISRIEPPKKKKKPVAEGEEAKKEGEDEDDRSCSDFLSQQWILWVVLGFTLVVGITTEVYGAVNGNGERIRASKSLEAQE